MEATMPQLLKPKDVAKILRCGEDHAREIMGSSAMKTVDISTKPNPQKRMLRVTPENLKRYIEGSANEN